jgi:nucleoid-associated protein YgaU
VEDQPEPSATVLSRAAEPDEVEPLWRTVIDANRQRLRSGDPDLIYPGETILIPDAG